MAQTIRVLVGDSCSLVSEGIQKALANDEEISFVGSLTCCEQLPSMCEQTQPDLLLLACNLATVACLEVAKHCSPAAKVLVLLSEPDPTVAHRFMQQGVAGVFYKNEPQEKLLEAISAIWHGKPWISAELLPAFIPKSQPQPGQDLAERDLAVLRLVAADKTNAEIAHALHLSPRTVGKHLSHINASLNSKSRAGAVAQALRHKLIE
jgi:DNA-binding NarL/FixJ family response regulator